MANVRMYELARELDIESRQVMTYLTAEGHFVRSASAPLDAALAAKVRAHFRPTGAFRPPVAGPVRPRRATRVVDIARALHLRAMDVLAELRSMGVEVKSFESTVERDAENRLRAAHGFGPVKDPEPTKPTMARGERQPGPRYRTNPFAPPGARAPRPAARRTPVPDGARAELEAVFGERAVSATTSDRTWLQAWAQKMFLPENAEQWVAAGLDRTESALASWCAQSGIEPRHLRSVRDDDGLTVLDLLRRGHSPAKIVATGLLERQ